jgi:hypothetical protein
MIIQIFVEKLGQANLYPLATLSPDGFEVLYKL